MPDLSSELAPLIEAQNKAREAELERIGLERERLEVEQRAALSAQRRERLVESLLSDVGQMVEKVNYLTLAVQYLSTEVSELSREIQNRLEHNQYVLSLLVEITRLRVSGSDPGRLSELLREADRVEFDFAETEELALRKRIRTLKKTLNELKIREAAYGIGAPVELVNEISYTEERIETATQELAALRERASLKVNQEIGRA